MRGTFRVLAPGEKIEEPTLTTIEEINETLEILMSEETLPQAPTWGGNVQDLMLVVEREAGSVAIINGANHSILKHIANIGLRPHVVSFSPMDPRWAFMTSRDGWVNKIDLYSLQLVRRVQVGFDTRGIAVSDDGRFVIAGNYVPNTL
jgi:DNA-binding beta-propeller fold protein YncE